MEIRKPTKPSNLMPRHFADNGVKNNFSSSLIDAGFSPNYAEVFQGDNLNYMLDSIGKELEYLSTIVDYINSIGVKKVPYINGNNKLDSTDINGLLPTQENNNGKYLTTNGSECSWSSDFRVIGEPIITLNFQYELPENCTWLDGTGGANNQGVSPITGDWAELFAIYGWTYDTSFTNTEYFRLPNFNNRVIWGGSTAGYISAGLPNITGAIPASESVYKNFTPSGYGAFRKQVANVVSGESSNTKFDNDFWNFDASRSSNIYGRSNTVQPPAIKARVYTRYK